MVERIDTVAKFELSEKTDIYRALLWIVSNLSPSLLRYVDETKGEKLNNSLLIYLLQIVVCARHAKTTSRILVHDGNIHRPSRPYLWRYHL